MHDINFRYVLNVATEDPQEKRKSDWARILACTKFRELPIHCSSFKKDLLAVLITSVD